MRYSSLAGSHPTLVFDDAAQASLSAPLVLVGKSSDVYLDVRLGEQE